MAVIYPTTTTESWSDQYRTFYKHKYATYAQTLATVYQDVAHPVPYFRSVDGAGNETFTESQSAGSFSGDIVYYAERSNGIPAAVYTDTGDFPYVQGPIPNTQHNGAASARVPNGVVTANPNNGYGFVGWWVRVSQDEEYTWQRLEEASIGHLSVGDAPNKLVESDLGIDGTHSAPLVRAVFGARFTVMAYRCADVTDPAYNAAYFIDGQGGDHRDFQATNGVTKNMPLASARMRCPGFVFVEWNTKQDGTGISVPDGGDVSSLCTTSGGIVRLFAIWRKATVTTSVAIAEGAPQQVVPTISVSPAPTDGAYAEGTLITAVAQTTGLVGVTFSTWTATGITIDSGDETNPELSFAMPANEVYLTANYVLWNVPISFFVDAASLGATDGSPSVVDASGQALPTGEDNRPYAPYGSTVVFKAPNPLEGYLFDGWYGGGVKKSALQNWSAVLGSDTPGNDVEAVAKYAVQVTVGKHEDGGTGKFSVDGIEFASVSSMSKIVTLGEEISIAAVVTTGNFDGWYVDDDASPSALPAEASVVVSEASSYVAHFVATARQFTITCQSERIGEEEGSVGTLAVAPGEGVRDNGDDTYTITGFRNIMLVATPSATNPLPLRRVVDAGSAVVDIARPVGVSGDATYKALWGTAVEHSVTAAVEQQSAGMGAVGIGDGFGPSVSMSVEEGEKVVFAAVPYGGYKFDGWYEDNSLVATSTRYERTVNAPVEIAARFSADTQAIFAWEGSSDNKTMEWTSKVYITAKPFDPVAARVDAAGYPVDLTVRTYSSPDKVNPLPVRDHALTSQSPLAVQSQDGRRLPRMRPERYIQITMGASHEIDAVVVGTNMTEVN